MSVEDIDLDTLYISLRDAQNPIDLDAAIREAAKFLLQSDTLTRAYVPAREYDIGEELWFGDDLVEVVDVRHRHNPQQGGFSVVDLKFPDGTIRRTAAAVRSPSQAAVSPAISSDAVEAFVRSNGARIRETLLEDERFAALLTPPTAARWGSVSSSSRLFSEDVLDAYISDDPLWATLRSDFTALVARRERAGAEGELWQTLVGPMLRRLGWSPVPLEEGQAASASFALFADPARAEAAMRRHRRLDRATGALALVTVVGWERPLGWPDARAQDGDRSSGNPTDPVDLTVPVNNTEPADQTGVLVGELLSTGVPWGILTNGRCWRLYRASWEDSDVGSTTNEYHEIDLGVILNAAQSSDELRPAQQARLRRWRRLFGVDGHRPGDDGVALVERLKQASSAGVQAEVKRLRRQLLEVVLPEVAGGFVAFRYQERGISEETEATLREIARASLGLIHRLISVLYAEACHMLPFTHPEYRGQSLSTLSRWATHTLDRGLPLSRATHATPRYEALLKLFGDLEHGRGELGLTGHGGGLFSPADPDYGFLERHRLSDRVVARTLAALVQVDGEPVDYGALTVRHISSLDEGLLENTLWVVEASAGQVAFVNASGGFGPIGVGPVPDYVGMSSVARALGGVMEARGETFAAAMDRVATLMRTSGEARESVDADELDVARQEALDALLGVRVLDPAMGSGLFLIYAVDVLVDAIFREMVAYHHTHPHVPWAWNPITALIRDLREQLRAEAARRGADLAPSLLEDGVMLTRLVAERAIYGIDRDPSAVALSRANLSMRAFAVGTPFPRLTAHLLLGDSLSGARIQEVKDLGLDGLKAFGRFADAAQAAKKDEPAGLVTAPHSLASYEVLCDLLAGRGAVPADEADVVQELGERVVTALRGDVPLTEDEAESLLARAAELRSRYHFVHWDLAFPEVFLEPRPGAVERSGFDVILGSPPVAAPETTSGSSMPSTEGERSPHISMDATIAQPFLELARELLRQPGGRIAFVLTPSTDQRDVEGNRS